MNSHVIAAALVIISLVALVSGFLSITGMATGIIASSTIEILLIILLIVIIASAVGLIHIMLDIKAVMAEREKSERIKAVAGVVPPVIGFLLKLCSDKQAKDNLKNNFTDLLNVFFKKKK